jgi:hypothetical protein
MKNADAPAVKREGEEDPGKGALTMSVAPESGRNRIMIYGPKGDGTTQWPSGKALTGSTRRHCGPPALAMQSH